jgi:protein phosphatase 2C family protein 2/3
MAQHLAKNIDTVEDKNFDDLSLLADKCVQTDEEFLTADQYLYNDDGCACIFTLVSQKAGIVHTINGNIGDSRTIFAKHLVNSEDSTYQAIACSHDHKPTDEKERDRITAAGGYVSLQRVDGQLALSRAFGDRQLKTPQNFHGKNKKVTSNPDFINVDGGPNDFLFMACDGIYEADIFDRQGVIDWIAKKNEINKRSCSNLCRIVRRMSQPREP